MLPDSILPTPEDDIARTLRDYERRLSHLETLEGGGGGFEIGARVFNSANIPIANNNFAVFLTFDSERYDTDGIHSTILNTGRLTARTVGKYHISAAITFFNNAVGRRQIAFRLNGALLIDAATQTAVSGLDTDMSMSTIFELAIGDYIEVRAYQNSGGVLNVINTANYSPEFMMQKIG